MSRLPVVLLVLAACDGGPSFRAEPDAADVDPVADGGVADDDATRPADAASAIPDAPAPDADPGDGCATPATGDWVGTALRHEEGSGSFDEVAVEVRWTLVASHACVDHFVPSGTARYAFVSLCTVHYDPSTVTIEATDGELEIDRSTTPARYRLTGTTRWSAVATCFEDVGTSEIGGTWVTASGQFQGAVIDGVTRPYEQMPSTRLEYHFRRADASFPPPTPCVGTPAETWTFGGSVSDGAEAAVTWTRASTDGCRDHYVPSGTATRLPYPSPACATLTFAPASGPIEAGDGSLVVDRATNPPTFDVIGYSEWPGKITCTHADGSVEISDGGIGGLWATFGGAYDGDQFSGVTEYYSMDFSWQFAR